jgi:hypothetical protein
VDAFELDWRTFHPNTPPASWVMRQTPGENWVRFHALPESKRYAETDHERAIIIARMTELAGHVLGEGQECWLVGLGYLDDEGDLNHKDPLPGLPAAPSFEFTDGDDGTLRILAFGVSSCWRSGAHETVLLQIASNETRGLWMSKADGSVFAPYDGGADLFLPSKSKVLELRERFSDWLSQHPRGL